MIIEPIFQNVPLSYGGTNLDVDIIDITPQIITAIVVAGENVGSKIIIKFTVDFAKTLDYYLRNQNNSNNLN